MERVTINISGMSCGHCVAGVRKALSSLGGVTVEEVRIGSATLTYDPGAVSSARIAEAIESEGYAVTSS